MNDHKFKKWAVFILANLPELIAGTALIITLVSTGVNVFTRYVLKFTYYWYSDVTVLAFGWMVFPGAAAAYKRHMHFGIDMLVNKLPGKAHAVYMVLFRMLLLVILALIFYSSLLLTAKVAGKQFPTILLSYKYFDASIVAGFGLMIIYGAIDLVKDFRAMLLCFKGTEASDT